MLKPPAKSSFPEYPATWYLFGASRGVGKHPESKDLLGRRLVAFRTERGEVAVLDAACSHLSADLSLGKVVGECLQCPFHQWQYDTLGRCIHIPAQAEIPAFARQRYYPTIERHGQIFFFLGSEPLFPLPFFEGCRPEDFRRGRPFSFAADLSWYMIVANGFDEQHFLTVHDRRLLQPPVVTCPTPLSRCVHYRAEVVGDTIYDAILRKAVGRTVEISITSHGGPLVLVTGTFQRAKSYLMISVQPRAEYDIQVEVTVFSPRQRNPLLRGLTEWLGLEVRRLFTQGFMQNDISRLRGIRYNRNTLLDCDLQLKEFFDWVGKLPTETHVIESPANAMSCSAADQPAPSSFRKPVHQ